MKRNLRRAKRLLQSAEKLLTILKIKRETAPSLGLNARYIEILDAQINECKYTVEKQQLVVDSWKRILKYEKYDF